jgi:hypothetical protein
MRGDPQASCSLMGSRVIETVLNFVSRLARGNCSMIKEGLDSSLPHRTLQD